MNDTERAALAILGSTPGVLRAMLAPLPDSVVSMPLERDWSPRSIVIHLLDVDHIGFRERLERMVAETHPSIVSITDVLERMESPKYAKRPVGEMIDEFEAIRRESCAWLATLTENQLKRTAEHDTVGEVTISNLLHYWPHHDLGHLRQVQRMLRALLQHHMGNAAEWDI